MDNARVNTIHLHGVAYLQKCGQVGIGVLRWQAAILVILDHVDQGRLQLEVIGING